MCHLVADVGCKIILQPVAHHSKLISLVVNINIESSIVFNSYQCQLCYWLYSVQTTPTYPYHEYGQQSHSKQYKLSRFTLTDHHLLFYCILIYIAHRLDYTTIFNLYAALEYNIIFTCTSTIHVMLIKPLNSDSSYNSTREQLLPLSATTRYLKCLTQSF